MFTGPSLCTASFCIMNGIVLFLILHIYTGAKGTNSSKKDNQLKYRYLIGSVSFLEEMVSLGPLNMCRIRNRTIPFIETGK